MLNSPCFNFKMFLVTPEVPKGFIKICYSQFHESTTGKKSGGLMPPALEVIFSQNTVTSVYASRAAVQNLKAFLFSR